MKNLLKMVMACGIVAAPLAYADLTVTNHSKAAATADAINPSTGYHSSCSSFLGSAGIMEPGGKITVPDGVISMICSPKCEVNVYMDRNCNARKIAKVVVVPNQGVKSVDNVLNAGFHIAAKSKTQVSIEDGSAANNTKPTIFETMMRKLGI